MTAQHSYNHPSASLFGSMQGIQHKFFYLLGLSLMLTLYGCVMPPTLPVKVTELNTFYNPQTTIKTARSMTFNYSGLLNVTEADGYSHCELKGEINNRNQAMLLIVCNLEYVAFNPNRFIYVHYDSAMVKGIEKALQVQPLNKNYGICLKKSRLCSTQEEIAVPIKWTDLQTIINANAALQHSNDLEVTVIGPLNEVSVIVPQVLLNQITQWFTTSLK